MKEIILNKEYTYSQICEVVGWEQKAGNSKKAQIKEIESCFEFYHPINKKTHKEKKSYIFTKQLRDLVEPSVQNNGGSNNNKNITPMIDYLLRIATEKEFNVGDYMTLTHWFCGSAGLDLMDKDIYVEQFGSDEELQAFCAEYHISKPRLFREYMGIIRKHTKDIFLKALEVMAKKNLVEYTDGYEFYYKMNKRGRMGYIFTNELNDTVHGLEEKNCNELNDAYNLSQKMAGRRLLMCINRKPEIKEQFDDFMNNDLNVVPVWDILNVSIDKEYKYNCHVDDKHSIQSYYRAIEIDMIEDTINQDCDKDGLATAVTNVIRRVSRRELLNMKWKDKYGNVHMTYDSWEDATDIVTIEKLLFTHFDEDFDDGTSLDLAVLDNELKDFLLDDVSQNGKSDGFMEIPTSPEDEEELNRLFDRVSIA